MIVNEAAEPHSSPQRLLPSNGDGFLSLTQNQQTLLTKLDEKSNVSPLQSTPISPTRVRSPIPVSPPSAKASMSMFDPLMNSPQVSASEKTLLNMQHAYLNSPTQIQGYKMESLERKILNRAHGDNREYHLATLGSKLKQSAVHNKHKRWSSFDTSALKSSNLLGLRGKGVRDKGIKSQPHTPIIKDRKKIPNKNPISPSLENKKSLHMADFTTGFTSMNSNSGPMKQKDLLDSIFNLAPAPSKHVPDTSFLNNETTTSFAGAYQTKLRTSEIEPSPHQIELPVYRDVMVFARLCKLMEQYRGIDKNFDFTLMIGLSRLEMEGFVQSQMPPLSSSLKKIHSNIVQSVLQCADDLVLEDYISSGKNADERVEVAIFRSDILRQIITVWRGTTEGQIKPVRNREMRSLQGSNLTNLKDGMLPSFQSAFAKNNLEKRLFDRLEKLMEVNPFFDLTTTGFSQGAALATICASRYASSYPMMIVHCNVFGCPKIGLERWRNDAHSLPNLKIVRIQTEDDSFADAPSDPHFIHVGHTILLCSGSSSIVKHTSPSVKGKRVDLQALAFKFDRPAHTKSTFFKMKKNHSVDAYLGILDQFSLQKLPWVTEYVGEDVGTGVHGMKNEKRNMV